MPSSKRGGHTSRTRKTRKALGQRAPDCERHERHEKPEAGKYEIAKDAKDTSLEAGDRDPGQRPGTQETRNDGTRDTIDVQIEGSDGCNDQMMARFKDWDQVPGSAGSKSKNANPPSAAKTRQPLTYPLRKFFLRSLMLDKYLKSLERVRGIEPPS